MTPVHGMQRWLCLGLALALAATAAPAAEPKGKVAASVMSVTALPDGKYKVGEETCDLKHLPKTVRGAGATKNTVIEMAIDDSTGRDRLVSIGRTLASDGFTSVVYVKPRKVDAYVSQPVQFPTSNTREAVQPPKVRIHRAK